MRTLVILTLLALSAPAAAQDRPLSARGRQIVDGSVGGSWSNANQPGLFNRTPHYALWVRPSWVYFVRAGIGIGAYVGYRFARESTGIEGKSYEQAPPFPQFDDETPRKGVTYQPFSHDVSLGLTAVLRLFTSGRVSLFARPYVGLAVTWREVRVVSSFPYVPLGPYSDTAVLLDPNRLRAPRNGWQWRHELRPQAGVHLPVVYQLTDNLGFGLGPDFHWQHFSSGFDAFEFGFSSWIVRAF